MKLGIRQSKVLFKTLVDGGYGIMELTKASPFGRGVGGADGEGKMEQISLKKNNKLLNVARILRRNMTRQEKHLWYDFLQHYPLKIYKQRIIDNFIVDFYCHSALLIIELDGSQHYTTQGKAHDEARTETLEGYGICVLRFSNKDVDDNFEGVCHTIDRVINERINTLSPAIAGALPKGESLEM